MARNPKLAKLKRQQFKRRRGSFKPFGEDGYEDVFVHPALKPYWSQHIGTSQSVDRSQVPDQYRGFFEYRKHAKTIGSVNWLDTIFPGVNQASPERRAAMEAKVRAAQLDATDPTSCLVLNKTTRFTELLYYTIKKDKWWFVFTKGMVMKISITYATKENALRWYRRNEIRWYKPVSLDSS